MAPSNLQGRYRLASQLLDLIRDRGFAPGEPLREQTLADLLGVSRTPVRAALSLLAERGIVISRPNHGYVLVRQNSDLAGIALDVPATADQSLYSLLVKDRLAGALPMSMTQSEVERRYGVDRQVLMRTLALMAEDGLIERNKGRGWTFLPSLETTVALKSSYDFRLTVEPAIFLFDTFRVDAQVLARNRAQHEYVMEHPDLSSVTARQLFEVDAAFHEMCADFSCNAFIFQAIQQQNRLRRLYEFGSYENTTRVREWCSEHLQILDAIASDAPKDASALMRHHLRRASENALGLPREQPL
ncbi:GntR family transcriptional regulator [Methylobacterium sp. NEAU 140]|uniref:GntR family transcriptional regulator n=1 Tax=Methylobacterium sp. NEAU 140 TaxID=3064945 RepID=UPI0027353327|nr:GntR family transcriptional regulator [Methylobacterium sp. NEAU 140]MDP4023670.1 GntR family transcriptional regulator [Methylobacterium sp. NEAU 140]